MTHKELEEAIANQSPLKVSSGYSAEWGRIASTCEITDLRGPKARLALVQVHQLRAEVLLPKSDIYLG